MWNHSLRSAVVLLLLLGTLALAVPYVSSVVDAWLFSEGPQPPQSKWKANRPNAENEKKPATAKEPVAATGRPLAYESDLDQPSDDPPFAFDFQEEPRGPGRSAPGRVKLIEHVAPPANNVDPLEALQRQIQDLGAAYLTVEVDGDRYECRSLFPLSPQSSYQKAFSAFGTTPQAAMEQVLAEAKNWKRATAAQQR